MCDYNHQDHKMDKNSIRLALMEGAEPHLTDQRHEAEHFWLEVWSHLQYVPLFSIISQTIYSHLNRNQQKKAKQFPMQISPMCMVVTPHRPSENCLDWKWLLCELCFVHRHTIDNRQWTFFAPNFTKILLMWPHIWTSNLLEHLSNHKATC